MKRSKTEKLRAALRQLKQERARVEAHIAAVKLQLTVAEPLPAKPWTQLELPLT